MKRIPRLHLVTDDDVLARPGIVSMMKTVLEAGGADVALHVRGPSTNGREIHELVTKMRPITDATGGSLFLNDRLDVALTAGADGVHLGQRSLPVHVVRSGPQFTTSGNPLSQRKRVQTTRLWVHFS